MESLQDEYKLDGKNKGGGVNYGHNDTSNGGYNSPVGNVSYGESKGDSKWVNNQTSIIAENGGNINVGETLTNIGSIIGSKNDTMNIEAKELVTENLKDHDNGKEYPGSNLSEIFSDGDMGNNVISVVTPTGKVYQYNQGNKSILYYGTINVTQPINQNNFEIKTEKFNGTKLKLDSSLQPMIDINGKNIFDTIQYEKVIVHPINNSGGKK